MKHRLSGAYNNLQVKREIVINASALEVRVALLEDNSLAEFYLERDAHRGLVGNIYKGKVTRVLPGMQAAFVDVGLDKAGFLHVSDFQSEADGFSSIAEVIGEEDVETDDPMQAEAVAVEFVDDAAQPDDFETNEAPQTEQPQRRGRSRAPHRSRLPIEQQLRRGQEIIVQVAKEPMGTKGARLTSSIPLPGRYPVTPRQQSSQVAAYRERGARAARAAVSETSAQGGLSCVRREGPSRREIQRDIAFLTKTWTSILKNEKSPRPPFCTAISMSHCARCDLFSSEVDRLWCDDSNTYSRIVQFIQTPCRG